LNDYIFSTAIQSDGKIVAGGYFENENKSNIALVRYNTNGSLDNTFGTNGIVTTTTGISSDHAFSIAIQSDKKIVAAGFSYTDIDYSVFTIARYIGDSATGLDEENPENIPVTFLLEQNYPNPFNSSTIIKYQIPKSSFVSLKVYDILGREVVSLVNEEKLAGNYQTEFKASDLTSGIYFYTILAGDFRATKKMILIK